VSYESKLHDIYNDSFSSQMSLNALSAANSVTLTNLMPLPISSRDEDESKVFNETEVDHLVCNFNDREV
jgi:hypothetical protein